MVRWHHRLNRHEFEQAPGAGDGQGSLACCSPWGRKESDKTERLNTTTQEGPASCKTRVSKEREFTFKKSREFDERLTSLHDEYSQQSKNKREIPKSNKGYQ